MFQRGVQVQEVGRQATGQILEFGQGQCDCDPSRACTFDVARVIDQYAPKLPGCNCKEVPAVGRVKRGNGEHANEHLIHQCGWL